MAWHIFHNWRLAGASTGTGRSFDCFGKVVAETDETLLLYQCHCGAVKTKAIKGKWDIQPSKRER